MHFAHVEPVWILENQTPLHDSPSARILTSSKRENWSTILPADQKVQSTNMVQSAVSVVVTSLMVWVSIPHMGALDPWD